MATKVLSIIRKYAELKEGCALISTSHYCVFDFFCFRATMTHGAIPKEEREKIGILDTLVRTKFSYYGYY